MRRLASTHGIIPRVDGVRGVGWIASGPLLRRLGLADAARVGTFSFLGVKPDASGNDSFSRPGVCRCRRNGVVRLRARGAGGRFAVPRRELRVETLLWGSGAARSCARDRFTNPREPGARHRETAIPTRHAGKETEWTKTP